MCHRLTFYILQHTIIIKEFLQKMPLKLKGFSTKYRYFWCYCLSCCQNWALYEIYFILCIYVQIAYLLVLLSISQRPEDRWILKKHDDNIELLERGEGKALQLCILRYCINICFADYQFVGVVSTSRVSNFNASITIKTFHKFQAKSTPIICQTANQMESKGII